jgi:DNA-binding SARP family transcriptional activator/TolB-like protein
MGGSVEVSVESSGEPNRSGVSAGIPGLTLRLLGQFTVCRGDQSMPMPASRKVRALIAYLALSPRAVTRAHLCELLWDVPQDPRGELRWCLSKARGVLDDPDRQRIQTVDDAIRLDLPDDSVDVLAVDRAFVAGIGALGPTELQALSTRFVGDFLEGLEIDRSPRFSAWLLAQRRRLRACHLALLERLIAGAADDEPDQAFVHLEKWLELAPLDPRAHELMLAGLARRGQLPEGEEHLARATRLFEAEGLDWRALGVAWNAARARPPAAASTTAATVAVAPALGSAPPFSEPTPIAPAETRRASIAVMPFTDLPEPVNAQSTQPLAGGFAHDLIMRLSKLRSLFVIAQGTMFALHARHIGAQAAARTLNAKYAVGGSVRRRDGRVTVEVELVETRSSRVLWAETFERKLDDALQVLAEIGDGIIASIESEIEAEERDRAILIANPGSLNAWEAHHRGLWHMYRFNRADNERARHWFETAVRLDPGFSRAFAGLSFTHWQDAFQDWDERGPAMERAYRTANQSLRADARDPAAHWALGRALWLRDQRDLALVELETAVEISPSFALGHYTLAFVHSQSGDPAAAISYADHSRHLSPFDPMLFGMLGARAMALVRQGDFDAAAHWGLQAAGRPNAHVHILAIGALTLALACRLDEAGSLVARIRLDAPDYRVGDFLAAFRFDPDDAELYRRAAKFSGLA